MKLFLAAFAALAMLGAFVHSAKASEGYFELKGTPPEQARCWAASVLMTNFKYSIIMSCRNIIYPLNTDEFTYLVWITPVAPPTRTLLGSSGGPQRLGALGVGKVGFTTTTAFKEIFVTREKNPKANTPSGNILVRGELKSITFLEETPSTSPLPATPTPTPAASPQTAPAQRTNVAGRLAIGAVIILFVVAVITVIAILVARSRFK